MFSGVRPPIMWGASTRGKISRVQSLFWRGYINRRFFTTSHPPFFFWYVNPGMITRVHTLFLTWDVNPVQKMWVESPLSWRPQATGWKVLPKRPYNGQTNHTITTILLLWDIYTLMLLLPEALEAPEVLPLESIRWMWSFCLFSTTLLGSFQSLFLLFGW